MDIKSMTDLMRTTMLKKIVSDNSTESLTGSSSTQSSDTFKMMMDVLLDSALNTSGQTSATEKQDNAESLAKLMSLTMQSSMLGGFSENAPTENTTGESSTGFGDYNTLMNSVLDKANSISGQKKETQASSGIEGTTSRVEIEQAIQAAAKKYGVDEDFIRAMVKQESGFRSDAVSKAGAIGLMQLMPKTADSLGVENPYNAMENIDGGTKYIKRLMDAYGGNKELALSAYNGGISRMGRRGVDTVEEISNMPKETQNYVSKIMKLYESNKK